ncbi:VanZ family protein [Chitinivorax sp. B]|uniref:VanZ family protein n=1 Tax=Chitinivorax sp. B TaxID=2502235 RepID=UPI001485A325|nr:VanZ family protein [Chitinivorax sp. B]
MPAPPQLHINYGDKLQHTGTYLLLMLWFAQLYPARAKRLSIMSSFIAMGVAIEYAQDATGYRSFDQYDMATNALGAILGMLLSHTFMGRLVPLLHSCLDHK